MANSGLNEIMSLGFLLSLKTVPAVILDIISCFGSVHFCQGKLVQVTKLEKFQYGIGIRDIAYADGKLFVRPYIAENTILVCSLDCIYQSHFHSPSGFAHFIISHDREIYTLDSTLFYIDVFNFEGKLKRSWPKFKHKVDKMWNYDEFHILIIFRHQLCAHVFDRNGELLYVFGDQEHHRFESSHRHEILETTIASTSMRNLSESFQLHFSKTTTLFPLQSLPLVKYIIFRVTKLSQLSISLNFKKMVENSYKPGISKFPIVSACLFYFYLTEVYLQLQMQCLSMALHCTSKT